MLSWELTFIRFTDITSVLFTHPIASPLKAMAGTVTMKDSIIMDSQQVEINLLTRTGRSTPTPSTRSKFRDSQVAVNSLRFQGRRIPCHPEHYNQSSSWYGHCWDVWIHRGP
jgi:hypothetical protein